MNDEHRTDELDEEFDLVNESEEVTADEGKGEGDVEFDYDDEGNIVIPDDSDDSDSEEEAEEPIEGEESEEDNEADKEQDESEEEMHIPEESEVVEPDTAPDERDAEIERLRKQLAERDAQIKDTLKSLGADENEGIAGLEKLAAEASDLSIDEYRKKRDERLEQEAAAKLVQRQKFEEKTRADLAAVQQAYPEAKQYKSVFEFPNFEKFSKYRDLGLPPDEAYIAANPRAVMASVAGAAQQKARNLNNTKNHLRSNVPVGSKDNSNTITKRQMAELRDIFPGMSDKDIVALHKQIMKK